MLDGARPPALDIVMAPLDFRPTLRRCFQPYPAEISPADLIRR